MISEDDQYLFVVAMATPHSKPNYSKQFVLFGTEQNKILDYRFLQIYQILNCDSWGIPLKFIKKVKDFTNEVLPVNLDLLSLRYLKSEPKKITNIQGKLKFIISDNIRMAGNNSRLPSMQAPRHKACHDEWNEDCKIFVGGLGEEGTRIELEDSFSKFGPIKNIWLAKAPPSFAYIEMEVSYMTASSSLVYFLVIV